MKTSSLRFLYHPQSFIFPFLLPSWFVYRFLTLTLPSRLSTFPRSSFPFISDRVTPSPPSIVGMKSNLAPPSPRHGWQRATASPCSAPSPPLCCPSGRTSPGSEMVGALRGESNHNLDACLRFVSRRFFSFSRRPAVFVEQCGHRDSRRQGLRHVKGCTQGARRRLHRPTPELGWNAGAQCFCLRRRWGTHKEVFFNPPITFEVNLTPFNV